MTTTTHNLTDNNTTLSVLFLNMNVMTQEKKRNKVFQILINKNIHNPNPRNTFNKTFDK